MPKETNYYIRYKLAESFILGQLELYKIQFAETSNNDYLHVMNELNETLETIKGMDRIVQRLSKENKKLRNENT